MLLWQRKRFSFPCSSLVILINPYNFCCWLRLTLSIYKNDFSSYPRRDHEGEKSTEAAVSTTVFGRYFWHEVGTTGGKLLGWGPQWATVIWKGQETPQGNQRRKVRASCSLGQLIKTRWRLCALVNWSSFVQVMACCMFGTKALPGLLLARLTTGAVGRKHFMGFESTCNTFYCKKYIRKWHLQNVGHFILTSMCYARWCLNRYLL